MAKMDFSPENLRKRFHELSADRAAIDKKLDPLRAELDNLVAGKGTGKMTVAQARKQEEKLRAQIRDMQEQLAPIETERAAVARALGGKTGVPGE